MHRSSESIAAIASALAKAQTTLVNPEKTMTATIRDDRRGQGTERSFRYAPLSAGLDLVRKALGQHELAVVQTTAIDEATRTVRLNTLLAHSSGEWIASDWPVCPTSDVGSPQRMGAALTYARRYGLFTLVGIAGEDDLDAPDLNGHVASIEPSPSVVPPGLAGKTSQQGNGFTGARTDRGKSLQPRKPILASQDSARMREAMLAEVASLASSSDAATWAGTMLGTKNTLTTEDARLVEAAFETKLAELPTDLRGAVPPQSSLASDTVDGVPDHALQDDEVVANQTGNDSPRQSVSFPITKTQRRRNKEHLKFVRTQPCLVCGRQPSDAHHLRFAQPQALGRKVSDEFTVPLCRAHHREAHNASKEIGWWQARGIAPLAVAETLWQNGQSGQALQEPARSVTQAPQRRSRRSNAGNGHGLVEPVTK